MRAGSWLDALTFPLLMTAAVVATAWGIDRIDGAVLTPLVIGGAVAIMLGLERWRPERAEFQRRDESLGNELGHFFLGTELGTVIGYSAALVIATAVAAPLRSLIGASLWPSAWPLPAQVALAELVSDLGSYGQHRAFHRIAALWPGHALHHRSPSLHVFKAGRFHALDYATGTFLIYAPLVILGAPTSMLVWVSILTGVLGVLQHANVRMVTPRWLDAIVCTPIVHWRHHSRARTDDGNFACVFTVIDHVFGTASPTHGARPRALGIAGDRPPGGFVDQLRDPLRAMVQRSPRP